MENVCPPHGVFRHTIKQNSANRCTCSQAHHFITSNHKRRHRTHNHNPTKRRQQLQQHLPPPSLLVVLTSFPSNWWRALYLPQPHMRPIEASRMQIRCICSKCASYLHWFWSRSHNLRFYSRASQNNFFWPGEPSCLLYFLWFVHDCTLIIRVCKSNHIFCTHFFELLTLKSKTLAH